MPRLFSLNTAALLLGAATIFFAATPDTKPQAQQIRDNFERIAQALEAYALDNGGRYPLPSGGMLPRILSTPIAYLSKEATLDPLPRASSYQLDAYRYRVLNIQYAQNSQVIQTYGSWIVASRGFLTSYNATPWPGIGGTLVSPTLYDATNGVVSYGDIFRSQRISSETGPVKP